MIHLVFLYYTYVPLILIYNIRYTFLSNWSYIIYTPNLNIRESIFKCSFELVKLEAEIIVHLTDGRIFPSFTNNPLKKKHYLQDENRYTETERQERRRLNRENFLKN